MKKATVGIMFFRVLEVNLILWILVGGYFLNLGNFKTIDSDELNIVRYAALIGFILAALLQHWSYYNIYKFIKESNKGND